ncbi:MAG: bifunctional serine/threonine-protein kinase/formylglycine-generating enzyme family protein [Halothece sp. Uz-M2-17]|nr:bifunctional serine/threonine-protein kinase/formylglycine-generating enzyme family protein [Halothece sp. Uz-M2-17]
MNKMFYKMLEGKWIEDKYHLKKTLGIGGFGAVFRADEVLRDRVLRQVAVKVIPPLPDTKQQEQQLEELIAAVNLNYPYLLRCFSAGEFNFANDEFLYLVTELADYSLEQCLRENQLSVSEVQEILKQITSGLDYLHRKHKQVHRDLKPGNILRVRDVWVISDFGLVRKLGTESYTQTVNPSGTVAYMPPEAFDGNISAGWDIWSLGIIIVAALNNGSVPYQFHGQTELIKQVISGNLELPHLPTHLKEVVEGCLKYDRKERWNAQQILEALQAKEEDHKKAFSFSNNKYDKPENFDNSLKSTNQVVWDIHSSPSQKSISFFEVIKRRKMIQFLSWGGISLGSIFIGRLAFLKNHESTSSSHYQVERKSQVSSKSNGEISPSKPVHLSEYRFEVVVVNQKGSINQQWSGKAKQMVIDLGDRVTLEMVAIPEGSFIMGAPEKEKGSTQKERPQHQVKVSHFLIGKYPVTQAQYEVIMGKNPSRFKAKDKPVEQVSWNDAVNFCKHLSDKTGQTYRLPSEAEWEYACRAGAKTPFYFGETITTELANYNGKDTYSDAPKGEYRQQTTPVGIFPPNALGLYDMHGNVYEWCQDVWHENYQGAVTDGSAWLNNQNNKRHVMRGGSWSSHPNYCRSAFRFRSYSTSFNKNLGFRIVASLESTREYEL